MNVNSITNTPVSTESSINGDDSLLIVPRPLVAGFEAVDTFERTSPRSPYTPSTNAWMDTVENPNSPLAERLTNLFLTPVMLPMMVVIDVVLMPLTVIGHFFSK